MLLADLNYLYSSVLFYLLSKIVCSVVSMTHKRSTTLSSIPEKSEIEEDNKWVPKKKHEVLKAKYKCLKKLFQIYDASVIGMLPEQYAAGDVVEDSEEDGGRKSRKRKRCHRAKMDAGAGTSDHDIETAVQVECSKTNTSVSESCTKVPSTKVYAATQASRESLLAGERVCASERVCACAHDNMMQMQMAPFCPRTRMSRQRKRTRFQSFLQRLLGLRSPNPYRGCTPPAAVSEGDIHHSLERRRRRRLRFRRGRRPTHTHSEGAMRPPALHCAQTVQRNCLLDTTPRQCPIAGCRMMLYGIINYNDHLNLCHFPGRRFVCHFCHEGFEREDDKIQHENEHIGLGHLTPREPRPPSPLPSCRSGVPIVTQTDPEPAKEHDEKLKKIVSFFDKIVDSTQMLTEMKKSRNSEANLRRATPMDARTEVSASDGHSKPSSSCSDVAGKRLTYSCNDLRRRQNHRSAASDTTSQCCSANCNFCGENFDYSQALERKYGEFHSCGALAARRRARANDGRISVTSDVCSALELTECASSMTQSSLGNGVLSLTDYEEPKLTRKPTMNVVYTASECSRRVSTRSLADRFKSYKWEPCTRIIRV